MKQVLLMIILRQIVLSYLEKVQHGRTMLVDDILHRFGDPLSTQQIMKKSANFDVTHLQENISLRYWLMHEMCHFFLHPIK